MKKTVADLVLRMAYEIATFALKKYSLQTEIYVAWNKNPGGTYDLQYAIEAI